MKKYLTTILLSLSVFIGEIHTFWNNCQDVENWIWREYRPMKISWNIKYVENEFLPIIYFSAWLLYVPNRVNRTAVKAMLCLAIMDIILYFYNFKQGNFGSVYFWYVGFFLLMYYGNNISKWLWQNLHPNSK